LNQKVEKSSRAAVWIVIAIVAASFAAVMPGAGAASPAVGGLVASPSFINLNRTTTVTLETVASMGAGEDNYLVTAWAPDGTAAGSAWYNFTAVGSMSKVLGNASSDFMAAVTQVGFYTLKAEWWNSTSAAFEPAAEALLQTTDVLFVMTELAVASNPYTDLHNCPLAEEYQRGDEIIARGWVRYASTGEVVNGTLVPSAVGNVTGTLFGLTKTIAYNKLGFWRAAWFVAWDQALGPYVFTVNASDGRGNHGTGASAPPGALGALRVIPATLKTSVWTANATTGTLSTAFYTGETVQVVVRSTYELHNAHNYVYTNTTSVLKNGSYPVGPDRSGAALAAIGYGAYNSTSGQYANNVANVTLTFDAATGTWRGTWAISSGTPLLPNMSLAVKVTDGAPTPNVGSASTTFAALPLPAPEVRTQYVNKTETVEVLKPGALEGPVAYGLAGGLLAAGLAVGFVLSRRGGGKAPPASDAGAAKSAEAPEKGKSASEEKKKDEGWD
jgi:hypothetical protein